MYHEQTQSLISRRNRRHAIVAAVVAALLVVIWLVVGMIRTNAREQGAASLRNAILESAKQCCAVEGSYPSSIDHLEESYGLRVNTADYVITYESYAGNVMPSVVVVPR